MKGKVILVVRDMSEARLYDHLFRPRDVYSVSSGPQRLEGLRIDQAFYTDYARTHDHWPDVYYRLFRNLLITKEHGHNPLGRIRNVEFVRPWEVPA